MRHVRGFFLSLFVAASFVVRAEAACPPADDEHDRYIATDEFTLNASSESGSAGDVVPVTFSLSSRIASPGRRHMSMAICHDPEIATFYGNPHYTEEFLALTMGAIRFEEDPGHGVVINFDFNLAYDGRFPSEEPLPLLTIDYKLKGKPGTSGLVTFCDGVLSRPGASCNLNELTVLDDGQDGESPTSTHHLSSANRPGTLSLPGNPPPPAPPPPPPAPDPSACPPPYHQYIYTDMYSFAAESASGAVGDVVAVNITFRSRIVTGVSGATGMTGMFLSICHDPDVAEPVGKPSYSDELLSIVNSVETWPVEEGGDSPVAQVGHGLLVWPYFDPAAFRARFPSGDPLTMMTIYYRLKGKPGDSGLVSFCDGILERANALCNFNFLSSEKPPDAHNEVFTYYLSTAHRAGTLTILDGPATHPDRPPEPPAAKVYPERPTDAQVDYRVEISGAAAFPGAKEVPVEVYVSADLEYSAIVIPVDFDERYLRLARAEDHFLTASVLIDNRDGSPGAGPDEGHAVIFTGLGVNSRRIAAEGEKVHAATLYFDVLEEAAEVTSTALTVVPVTGPQGARFSPWIRVWWLNQSGMTVEAVQAEVAPLRITEGRMAILPEANFFLRADSNTDLAVDLSDAVFTIDYLFLNGQPPLCPEAADANGDGAIDLTDPVVTLAALFLAPGGIPPPYPDPGPYLATGGLGCH